MVQRLKREMIPVDPNSHAFEHSIENQLPFIKHLGANTMIVPISLGLLDYDLSRHLAGVIVRSITDQDVGFIATSDFSHVGPDYGMMPPSGIDINDFVRHQDAPYLRAIGEGDSTRFLNAALSSSTPPCGIWPVVVMLEIAILKGFRCIRLLKYATSNEVFPQQNVVGFGAFAIYREK